MPAGVPGPTSSWTSTATPIVSAGPGQPHDDVQAIQCGRRMSTQFIYRPRICGVQL